MTSLSQAISREESVQNIRSIIAELRKQLNEANRAKWRPSERAKVIKASMHFIVAEMREIRYTGNTMSAYVQAWSHARVAYKAAKDTLMWKCKTASGQMAFASKRALKSVEAWLENGVS